MMPSPTEKVLQFLEELYALEAHLVSTLTAQIAVTPRSQYRDLLERHRDETRTQAQRIEQRLTELGRSSSLFRVLYDTAQGAVGQGLSLVLAPLGLLRGAGGEEKLLTNAKDAAASEALEIASYDALEAVAEAVGDAKTAVLAREHRTQEEVFLEELRSLIPGLATNVVSAEVEGKPRYDATTTGAADAVRDASGKVKAATTSLRGQAEQAVASVADTAKEVADTVDDTVAEAVGRAGDAAAEIADTVEEVAGTIEGSAARVAGTAEDAATEVAGEVRGSVAQIAGTVEDAAAGLMDSSMGAAAEVVDGEAEVALEDEIAVVGYDELSVEQLLPKLKTLTTDELAAIDGYERGGRSRKRVLDRIAALRAKKVDEQLAKL